MQAIHRLSDDIILLKFLIEILMCKVYALKASCYYTSYATQSTYTQCFSQEMY